MALPAGHLATPASTVAPSATRIAITTPPPSSCFEGRFAGRLALPVPQHFIQQIIADHSLIDQRVAVRQLSVLFARA